MPNLPETTDIYELGGVLANAWPVEDPTTDMDAGADNKSRSNVAMMSNTAIRGWVRFTSAASTVAMLLVAHNAVWGNGASVVPTLARTGVGIFTVTFPTTVLDPLGVSHTVNIRAAWMNSRGGSSFFQGECIPTSANVATIYIATGAGVASDAAGVDFDVFIF